MLPPLKTVATALILLSLFCIAMPQSSVIGRQPVQRTKANQSLVQIETVVKNNAIR